MEGGLEEFRSRVFEESFRVCVLGWKSSGRVVSFSSEVFACVFFGLEAFRSRSFFEESVFACFWAGRVPVAYLSRKVFVCVDWKSSGRV